MRRVTWYSLHRTLGLDSVKQSTRSGWEKKVFSRAVVDLVPVLRPLDPTPDVLLKNDGGLGPPQESNMAAGQEPANPLLDEQRRPQNLGEIETRF